MYALALFATAVLAAVVIYAVRAVRADARESAIRQQPLKREPRLRRSPAPLPFRVASSKALAEAIASGEREHHFKVGAASVQLSAQRQRAHGVVSRRR